MITLADASLSLLVSSGRAELAGSLAQTAEALIRHVKTKASRRFMNRTLKEWRRSYSTTDRRPPNNSTDQRFTKQQRPTNGGGFGSDGHFARGFGALVLLQSPHPGVGSGAGE